MCLCVMGGNDDSLECVAHIHIQYTIQTHIIHSYQSSNLKSFRAQYNQHHNIFNIANMFSPNVFTVLFFRMTQSSVVTFDQIKNYENGKIKLKYMSTFEKKKISVQQLANIVPQSTFFLSFFISMTFRSLLHVAFASLFYLNILNFPFWTPIIFLSFASYTTRWFILQEQYKYNLIRLLYCISDCYSDQTKIFFTSHRGYIQAIYTSHKLCVCCL